MNEQLTNTSFLMGDQFTVADAYLYNVTRWSRLVNVDISDMPALNTFMERVSSRPTVKAAIEAEGIRL